ncbi:MAG: type III-B CRISPR module RAMP protein Cmr6 [Flavobacteriales bacterium]|nr:type III-B CRISPR module RAMP protein Cmr6 [Flavobacteriales bacterium]MCB0784950.1 type III-B CRISPR module RAMP protein Cmr6 [Flavobacteriales bacterium]
MFWKTAYQEGREQDVLGTEARQDLPRTRNLGTDHFELTVAWPGLLAGLGYSHATGGSKEEVKLGFSLDHTTGLPYLPGSTVKGWLRHFFPGQYSDPRKQREVLEFLQEAIGNAGLAIALDVGDLDKAKALEQLIFAGCDAEKRRVMRPIEQDIFHDAVPVRKGDGGAILAEEVITPHRDPLKDPVPLRMLKVPPGVTFRFRFQLNDQGMPGPDKRKLFQYLIANFGIGAKTSNGFGQFQEVAGVNTWELPERRQGGHGLPPAPRQGQQGHHPATAGGQPQQPRPPAPVQAQVPTAIPWERLKTGTVTLVGTVVALTPNGLRFKLDLPGAPPGKDTVDVRYPARSESDLGKRFPLNVTFQGKGAKLKADSASMTGSAL